MTHTISNTTTPNSTQIIHSLPCDPLTGSVNIPIYQTSTFEQIAPGINRGFDYARSNNPTRKALEDLIAQLEGGFGSCAFSTGLAAIDAVLKLLQAGDEIVAVEDIYGGAYRLFTHVYEKLGIKVHYVDTTDIENIEAAITQKTKFIWIESPTNPTLKITDIKAAAQIAQKHEALLVVDNTFASPVAQNPIALGADIVVHSATKYIAGHSDLVAGLVVCKTQEHYDSIKFIQNASGGILGPWDCFLTIRGIETLQLRFRQQSATALALAEFLFHCKEVKEVYYPGLIGHKNHDIAAAQQNNLFGGVLSFSFKNDQRETAEAFLKHLNYFILAESLGGVKSLACHPAQMTHASVPQDKRLKAGIKDSLVRLSCGIEESEDLINDVQQALQNVSAISKQVAIAQ